MSTAPDGRTGDARVGDWLEVAGLPGNVSRRGQIVEVLGSPGHVHYRVRWDEQHESVFYPADGARVVHADEPH
jgi:hypothetical protein